MSRVIPCAAGWEGFWIPLKLSLRLLPLIAAMHCHSTQVARRLRAGLRPPRNNPLNGPDLAWPCRKGLRLQVWFLPPAMPAARGPDKHTQRAW